MKRHAVPRLSLTFLLAIFFLLRFAVSDIEAQNGHGTTQTRLLRTPTVSANQIAFAYANNIWVAPRAGGSARRLTSFQGSNGKPAFFARW
jgi:tricorn protease